MLETLAGRLRWERTEDGIRVEIPVRVPWLLTFISGIGMFTLPRFTVEIFSKSMGFTSPASFAPVWMGLCLGVIWFTMIFTIKHVLTLNPTEMGFQVRTFGIGVRKRTIVNGRLQNPRYAAAEYGATFIEMSRIQIDRDFKTRDFAFGITELEADTLIEKMMEIYKFPKYPRTNPAAPIMAGH
jgi:hypothetical protein